MAFDTLSQLYYNKLGGLASYNVNGSAFVNEGLWRGSIENSVLRKAATDAFDRAETQFFNPKFGALLNVWPLRQMQLFSILPKATYPEKGDAIKVISADPGTATDVTLGVTGSTQLYQYYDTPTLTSIIGADSIGIRPKIIVTKWKMDMEYILKNEFQYTPQFDANQAKAYFGGHHLHNMDKYLLTGVDTTAGNNLESIDRVISSSTEAGLTSSTADPAIYGTCVRTGSTYDAQVDSSSASRNLDLSMLNTILTSMEPYVSSIRNVVAVAHPLVINMIQDLEGSKQRYNNITNVELTLNGINTRPGVEVGFEVNSYNGGGIGPIPIIPDSNVQTSSDLTSSNGLIYFFDKQHLEMRVARPQTYLETSDQQMLAIDYLEKRHLIMYAGELIADKFSCHGKVGQLNGV